MPRPPLTVGTYGKIGFWQHPETGMFQARCSFRDFDGVRRQVTKWGRTKAAAEHALKETLIERSTPSGGALSADSRVSKLAEQWLEQVRDADRAHRTKELYADAVKNYVLPGLGGLRLREARVPSIDRALGLVRDKHGRGAAKTMRSVLSGMFALAARHGAIDSNPVRDTTPILTERKSVRALTAAEEEQLVDLMRSSPRAVELDLPDLTEWMLGTGMRIGEACAIREAMLDLDAGTAEVNATLIRVTGEGLRIQERPKTAAGWRVLALPGHLVEMAGARRTRLRLPAPQGVVFYSAGGHLRDPSNTAQHLKEVLGRLGLPDDAPEDAVGPFAWVTSHVFRKTVATRLDDAGLSARQIADVLGHSQPSMTMDVYTGRRVVSAEAAKILSR